MVVQHELAELEQRSGIRLVWIPPGHFIMGAAQGDTGFADEFPRHCVSITKGFWISATPLTRAQYGALVRNGESIREEANHPVGVSYIEAMHFCQALAAGLTSLVGCLPTEAEWEYACRAGTESRYYWGNDIGLVKSLTWLEEAGHTHDVGHHPPNPWGLYDLYGNVWEWCSDYYAAHYYQVSTCDDPMGSTEGLYRVLRGNSWPHDIGSCSSSFRFWAVPGLRHACIGFRVVLKEKYT